jgi:hypothetical protein
MFSLPTALYLAIGYTTSCLVMLEYLYLASCIELKDLMDRVTVGSLFGVIYCRDGLLTLTVRVVLSTAWSWIPCFRFIVCNHRHSLRHNVRYIICSVFNTIFRAPTQLSGHLGNKAD